MIIQEKTENSRGQNTIISAGLLQLEVQAGHLGILSEADSDSIGQACQILHL